MQFGIGVLFGFVVCGLCFFRVETSWAEYVRNKVYQRGYEDAEMKYNKSVKTVILEENTVDVDFECPCCGRKTVSKWEYRPQYCADCGCKIDWGMKKDENN